jgi:hypothetical protein
MGADWSHYYMTMNTGYGVPMLSTLPEVYSGKNKELFLCRARDLHRFEIIDYPYIRRDGFDVRIVRQKKVSGAYESLEIDRMPDRFQAQDTLLEFKLPDAVWADTDYTAEMNRLWVYYGRQSADDPGIDPDDVVLFWEGLENYSENSDLVGQNSWAGDTGFASVKHYSAVGSNKIVGGEQSALLQINDAVARKITRTVTSDGQIITLWVWVESGITVYQWLAIYDSASTNWFKIAVYDQKCMIKISTGGWLDTGQLARSGAYHKLQIKIDSNGFSGWINDVNVQSNNTFMTTATHIWIGTDGGANSQLYVDNLDIRKYIVTPGTLTLGDEEEGPGPGPPKTVHGFDGAAAIHSPVGKSPVHGQ